MADFGAPVAQNVAGPQQGIQTISALMGLRQQQLAIQQAQAGVAGAQAQAQQEQQKNQELQQAQTLAQSAIKGAYRNPDGSLNADKLSTDITNIGPYAAQFGQAIIARANEGIQNQSAINKLNTQEQSQVADTLLSVANNPNLTYSDVVDAVTEMETNNKDLARFGTSVMGMFHPDMNSEQLSTALKQMATSLHGAGVSPQLSQVQGPQGIQQIQTNLNAAAPIGPVGAPIRQGISPQIVTNPITHGQAVVGPGSTVQPIGPAPSAGRPALPDWLSGANGGWQPQPGQPEYIGQMTHNFVQRAQAGIQAANTAPQAIDALQRIDAILDQGTWTGTAFSGFKDLKNLAASIGIDTTGTQNASELVKNMARYEAARAAAVGNTDASRSLVEAGSPNFHMDAKAVKAVTQQSLANERIIQTYANLTETAPTPEIGMQREAQLRSIPHLLQTFELRDMKSKAEVDSFLKRYNLSGAELAKSSQALDQLLGAAQPATRASGGAVGSGVYRVGERGTETLHLAPGSSGFVTPNKETVKTSKKAALNYQIGNRWGGGIVSGPIDGPFLGPVSNAPWGPEMPIMPGSPSAPAAPNTLGSMFGTRMLPPAQQTMRLNGLMGARGFGGRFGGGFGGLR